MSIVRLSLSAIAVSVVMLAAAVAAEPTVEDVLRQTKAQNKSQATAQGGVAIHIGAETGELAAGLAEQGGWVVHALPGDASAAARVRGRLRERGLIGLGNVELFSSLTKLPHADNLANLIVADLDALEARAPSDAEITRVLAPWGVAHVKQNGAWQTRQKPLPAKMDDWTHWDYSAAGNPVSDDALVAPTTSLRWLAGPPHGATHAGVRAEGGRVLYFVDAAAPDSGEFRNRPNDYGLVCRDACNGVLLWQRDIGQSPSRHQLVMAANRIFLVPNQKGRLAILDAATGKTVATASEGPEVQPTRFVLGRNRSNDQGHFVLRVLGDRCFLATGRSVAAYSVEDARLLWERTLDDQSFVPWIVADDQRVYGVVSPRELINGRGEDAYQVSSVVAWNTNDGKQAWSWRAPRPNGEASALYRMIVAGDDLVLPLFYTSPDTPQKDNDGGRLDYGQTYQVKLLDVDTGEEKWTAKERSKARGHYQAPLVVENRVIVGNQSGFALDRKTGDLVSGLHWSQKSAGCAEIRGTSQWSFYCLSFLDQTQDDGGELVVRNQARSRCDIGAFPAYGLMYVQPAHCFCSDYLNGHIALAADATPPEVPSSQRLVKGDAEPAEQKQTTPGWRSFLADPQRASFVEQAGPAQPQLLWETRLADWPKAEGPALADLKQDDFTPGLLSAPTAADGRVYVALPFAHAVACVDAKTGTPAWRFDVGAKVDTPPSLHGGLCLFGCRDGWVYAHNAANGKLVWKRLVAPAEKRIVVQGQLESAWPVQSVVVHQGVLVAVAGRQSQLDGGLFAVGLDPQTGEKKWARRIFHRTEDLHFERNNFQPREVRTNRLLVAQGDKLVAYNGKRRLTIAPATGEIVEAGQPDEANIANPILWAGWCGFLSRRQQSLGRYDEPHRHFGPLHSMRFVITDDVVYQPYSGKHGQLSAVLRETSGAVRTTGEGRNASVVAKWAVKGPNEWDAERTNTGFVGAGELLYRSGPGMLSVYRMSDGELLNEQELKARPVLDGMALDGGLLFIAGADGVLRAYGDRSAGE